MSQESRAHVASHATGIVLGGIIGGIIEGVVSRLVHGWAPDPALAAVGLAGAIVSGIAFYLIYRRYAAILARRSTSARWAYDALRQSLSEGGLAAALYSRRLVAALGTVDRFFGDASMAKRTLFPHAFNLRTPAPLWTAAAFDRCLLLALLYPLATIIILWGISGHVGPAEQGLLLPAHTTFWYRASTLAMLTVTGYCFWRSMRTSGWSAVLSLAAAVAGAFAVAGTIAGTSTIGVAFVMVVACAFGFFVAINFADPDGDGVAGEGAVAPAGAFAIAGAVAVAVAAAVGGAVAGAFVIPVALVVAAASALARGVANSLFEAAALPREPDDFWGISHRFEKLFLAGAAIVGGVIGAGVVVITVFVAGAVAGLVAGAVGGVLTGAAAGATSAAVFFLNERARQGRWQGPFQAALIILLAAACLVGAGTLGKSQYWAGAGALLLFLGLLTLLNAPFDWAALGLTRALLRRGLERGAWYPYAFAMADAVAAALVIALLTVTCVLGVQAFDDLAARSGGKTAVIVPLDKLFDGIAAKPAAPEFWWTYAMLLSTMIPSLVNLAIGGTSLLRGIPWITALLLRNMPERGTPPHFDRPWMTALLTAQVFAGGLLGFAAQGLLVYVVVGWFLPLLGLDLLDLARAVAAADLPHQIIRWFAASFA